MKSKFETLLIERKNELLRCLDAYANMPEPLKSEYEKRQMLQNSARLLEISLLAQRLGVKDAE